MKSICISGGKKNRLKPAINNEKNNVSKTKNRMMMIVLHFVFNSLLLSFIATCIFVFSLGILT